VNMTTLTGVVTQLAGFVENHERRIKKLES
jgi:hypothetical protein